MEDHPTEYFDFEGVIPKGQYGGGEVAAAPHALWRSGVPAAQAEQRLVPQPDQSWAAPSEEELTALDEMSVTGRWTIDGRAVRLTNFPPIDQLDWYRSLPGA